VIRILFTIDNSILENTARNNFYVVSKAYTPNYLKNNQEGFFGLRYRLPSADRICEPRRQNVRVVDQIVLQHVRSFLRKSFGRQTHKGRAYELYPSVSVTRAVRIRKMITQSRDDTERVSHKRVPT